MATILVIEDDAHSANIVQRTLNKQGHAVIIETEGLKGLQRASQGDVDLVLLDLGLPDMPGHVIATLIKRIPGNIPIVAVTGRVDDLARTRAARYGCTGYITKPLDTRQFPQQVASFLPSGLKSQV